MKKTPDLRGLRERIRDAENIAEISSLKAVSTGYDLASKKTRRRWATTAARRIAQLQKTVPRTK